MADLDQCAECGRFFGETSRLKAQLTQAQAEIAALRRCVEAADRVRQFYGAHGMSPPDAFAGYDQARAGVPVEKSE